MAELQVDAFAGGLGGHAHLPAGQERILRPAAFLRVHSAVDGAGGVAPRFEVLAQVVEGVAVLGEDEQLAAPILQLGELRALQAFP